DGLLLLDKKPGITSHDAVERFRRRSKIKKVGHTGTLDPLATGLLVLCVGKATRLQAYLMGMEKTYEGTIQFGWATDSYDAAGTHVRSLAHELGVAAGVPAHLKELRRTAIGNFHVDKAISFDRMSEAPMEELLAPPHFQPLSDVDLPLERVRIDWSQQGKM